MIVLYYTPVCQIERKTKIYSHSVYDVKYVQGGELPSAIWFLHL
jgi:hypothetical protein